MLTEQSPQPILAVAPTAPARRAPELGEKPAVLVVDDEYGPRESIAFSLSAEFSVDTAGRAREALAKVQDRAYAVVLLDIRMPEMNGISVLEELRKIDAHVAVIMLTGYGTLQTAQQAMLAGANQYLRKPPDIPELVAAVRRQAQATRLRRAQAAAIREEQAINAALKREIEQNEPQIWQARASVELVHDLNNPLTVVIGYASLVAEEARLLGQQDPELGRKLAEYAGMVERAAAYCHHLAQNWRRASRHANALGPVDLVRVASEVRQVIFFSHSAIHLVGLEKAWVRGSEFELMRVFQNLFKNSLDAGANRLAVTFGQTAERLTVTVSDDGVGMDADRVKRALHGGFSTKSAGTGLGLSICRHLLGAHGATFNLESAPGRGTVVSMTFPQSSLEQDLRAL